MFLPETFLKKIIVYSLFHPFKEDKIDTAIRESVLRSQTI